MTNEEHAVKISRRQAVTTQIAHQVKKAWCAHYEPDRVAFGKKSRCVGCCVNQMMRCYDPELLDMDCKHVTTLFGRDGRPCLPEPSEAIKRYGV